MKWTVNTLPSSSINFSDCCQKLRILFCLIDTMIVQCVWQTVFLQHETPNYLSHLAQANFDNYFRPRLDFGNLREKSVKVGNDQNFRKSSHSFRKMPGALRYRVSLWRPLTETIQCVTEDIQSLQSFFLLFPIVTELAWIIPNCIPDFSRSLSKSV